MNKSNRIYIRISDLDKEALQKLAEKKQMSMSEYIIYLIRRETDKEAE